MFHTFGICMEIFVKKKKRVLLAKKKRLKTVAFVFIQTTFRNN